MKCCGSSSSLWLKLMARTCWCSKPVSMHLFGHCGLRRCSLSLQKLLDIATKVTYLYFSQNTSRNEWYLLSFTKYIHNDWSSHGYIRFSNKERIRWYWLINLTMNCPRVVSCFTKHCTSLSSSIDISSIA